MLLRHKQTQTIRGLLLVEAKFDLNSTMSAHQKVGNIGLSQISPDDERWDNFRQQADRFRNLYRGTIYDRYADRINECSGLLEFITTVNPDTGESKLKLKSARFCRVPRCPVCQWRRSLMWRAKAFKVIPKIFDSHPSARFVFLTLTVKNCALDELRSTLSKMNAAWKRLIERNQFPAIGWIKAVEVTRGDDDTAHPHFHCLLMVNPSYLTGKTYLSHKKWTELWQSCLRVEYTPIVHIQTVKTVKGANQGMLEAVLETIKYSVKPGDVLRGQQANGHVSDRDWLVELTKQLYKTKSIATGGLLKDYLQELETDPEDLIHADELLDTELMNKSVSLYFAWNEHIRKYMSQIKVS